MTTPPAVPDPRLWLALLAAACIALPASADPAGPAGLSDLPLAAQAQISARLGRDQPRYHARSRSGGLQLENAGVTAAFDVDGMRIRAGASTWGLRFTGYGYSDAPGAPVAVAPRADANRVEYRRGPLTEWYVNGPVGLEQGFTLEQAPGARTGAPLTLAFALSGNLAATVDATGDGASLRAADGTAALRYRGLVANDATGRELPSWLEVDGTTLRLRVDDRGARYPIVIDPFIEQATLVASDGAADDQFGLAAVDGDTIVVGAHLDDVGATVDQGSAYVFVKPEGGWTGTLTEHARLVAADGAAGDAFGLQVAVHGDTIVVGARWDDHATRVNQGSAYVFVKPAGGWNGTLTQSAKLTALGGFPGDWFGDRVAVHGNVVVVGARLHDSPPGCLNCTFIDDRGAAYVFVKPAAGWSGGLTQTTKLNPSNGFPDDEFGMAVAVDGDVVVVGAWQTGTSNAGTAYVYVKPASGWPGSLVENARLVASDAAAQDLFGVAAGVSGDTIVVGAYRDDVGSQLNQGSAYIFVKPAAGWSGTRTEAARLFASDGAAADDFGFPVAIDADTIVVGAIGANADRGAAYVFERPAAGWSGTLFENDTLVAADVVAGDLFANGVDVSGETIVVSAHMDDVGGMANRGSARVFVKNALPASLGLDPPSAESPVGASHTVTATVVNTDGAGIADVTVRFEVTGTVTASGSCTTAPSGGCDFTYDGPTTPGVDSIGAFADTDGDGFQDPDEPGNSASKAWVAAAPASVGLTPSSAEGPVGTSHTVTAAVADGLANPVGGVTVRFSVGGAVSANDQCVTGPDGRCAVSYTGPTAPGADTITAFADTDGNGLHDAGEPSGSATKTWVAGAPATVVLAPPSAVSAVGTTHTVLASVADTFGNATAGIAVRFAVGGAATASGSCTTDGGGRCAVSYQGPTTPGTDTILAFADTDGDGAQDADEPAGAATKTWVAGAPSTVAVAPDAATSPVGTEHCVTATVADSFGNPNAGALVRFAVAGSVIANDDVVTDAGGVAPFCYAGPELPGADEITAHADTDADGVVDAGEPVGAATNSWLLPESTPGQASGGGHVPSAAGGEDVAFGFSASNDGGTLRGACNVIDRAAGVRLRCVDVTSFVRTGPTATIFGNAEIAGASTPYRLQVHDGGEPGAGVDAFTITTDGGYGAGGLLTRGNVQVRQ